MIGSNCCAQEMMAIWGPSYDEERMGAYQVISPRHADILVVAGSISKELAKDIEQIYLQIPEPKWVIAMGACAIDGGLFAGSYATVKGLKELIPVSLFVPGCPPRPEALMAGIVRLQRSTIGLEEEVGAWGEERSRRTLLKSPPFPVEFGGQNSGDSERPEGAGRGRGDGDNSQD
jgi:NADH-quinone oxidoreductase B subunit